jgi:ribosome-binding factor A
MTRRAPRAPSHRRYRVGETLRHALAEAIARGEVRDAEVRDVPITVTEVQMSPDLREATAFVIPLGGENAAAVLEGLQRSAPGLRAQLARAVKLRYAPALSFELDRTFENASHIESLLQQPKVAADLGEGGTERGELASGDGKTRG